MKHSGLTTPAACGVLLAGLLVTPALAAPFCIRNQVIPPQCLYYDPQQCQHEAQRQNAECVVNPTEMQLTAGYGKYCVVTSGGVSNCNYTDQNTCIRVANQQSGACTLAPTDQPFQAPDPYSPVNGN